MSRHVGVREDRVIPASEIKQTTLKMLGRIDDRWIEMVNHIHSEGLAANHGNHEELEGL